jgi:hypothetical protein
MASNFPNSPTLNQTYTADGKVWAWNGIAWAILPNTTPIPSTIVSATAPTGPLVVGVKWLDTTTTIEYTYINDGDSFQWVELGAGYNGYVTVASTQTLTNKTLTTPTITSPTGLVKADVGLTNVDNTSDATKNSASATLTNKTLTNPVLTGYTETVFTLGTSGSQALNAANGTFQNCGATATVTFTDSLSAGQSIILMLLNGSTYTINWPTTTWVTPTGNVAPTLSAANTLVFWKIGTTLYASVVGKSA